MVLVEIQEPSQSILWLQKLTQILQDKNKALKKSETLLKETQRIAHIGSWEIDLQNDKVSWSDELYRIYHEDPETFQPSLENSLSMLDDQDRKKMEQAFREAVETGERQHMIHTLHRRDGTTAEIELFGQAIFDEEGNAVKIVGSSIDITEQVQLQRENEELANLMQHSLYEIYILDYHTYRYLYVNDGAVFNLGYTREELLQMTVFDINPYLTMETVERLREKACKGESISNFSIHRRKDGSTYPVQASLQRITYKGREAYVIFDSDISELKKAEEKLADQYNILHSVLNATPDLIYFKDYKNLDGKYIGCNKAFESFLGKKREEIIGHDDLELYGQDKGALIKATDMEVMREGKSREENLWASYPDGHKVYLHTISTPFRDASGETRGILGISRDRTKNYLSEQALREQKEILSHQAHHDALTELPNRLFFKDKLGQAIARAKRDNGRFALLFLDLDQFKQINDSLGHDIGDKLLRIISGRLKDAIREEDTLVRFGGDEFIIIMENIKSPQAASTLAQKLIDSVQTPIQIKGYTLFITFSIGISLFPEDSQEPNDLLKYADTAMYKAKEDGRNTFQFYSADMTELAFERVVMETSLRQALARNEFLVYYQPQIDAVKQKVVGIEALVRWQHPTMGLVTPNHFIPLAEETGLITELDQYVIRTALKQVVEWNKQGIRPGKLALNLNANHLLNQNQNFITMLKKTMEELDFDPTWLEFEVTESQIMKYPEQSISRLKQISALGISIAIDDFGTGYSSLAYLKNLPGNKLKIDRSFIHDVVEDEEDAAITKAIIMLAKSLHLNVIAEGVETEEQKNFLMENGCNFLQGFYFGYPMNAEDMGEMLAAS